MPTFRIFISPEELIPGRIVTYDEVAAVAANLNRAEALHFLGFLNLLLSSATAEAELTGTVEPLRDVQTYVFREVVSADLLRRLKERFASASLMDRPILHRTQMLLAIRLVATHGQTEGGNRLQVRGEFDVIGDLLFLINGLFRQERSIEGSGDTALWLAASMVPMHETENPPDVSLSWPRIQDLLINRLPSAGPNPAVIEAVQKVTATSTGLSLQGSIDLSWMLFSYWAGPSFQELMRNRGRAYLNPAVGHEVVSAEHLQRAITVLGVRFDELAEHLRIDQYSQATLFDLSRFRSRPLWMMPDGLILCIDAVFMLERLGPHAFWSVMNALDSATRRHQFSSAWGLAFERYCLTRLAVIFRGKKWNASHNPTDSATNDELADMVAVRKGSAILIECKGTFIRTADKYSGNPLRFFRGTTKKFGCGKHGGVHQLLRSIATIWVKQNPQPSVPNPETISDVFPILIGQDPALGCSPMSRLLSDRFLRGLERIVRKGSHITPKVWPLAVLTADDLDRLEIVMTVATEPLDALLKRFHRTHLSRMIGFGEFLSSVIGNRGITEAVQFETEKRFRENTTGTIERLKRGEYGALPTAGPEDTAPAE